MRASTAGSVISAAALFWGGLLCACASPAGEPPLPAGLGGGEPAGEVGGDTAPPGPGPGLPFALTGFADVRGGVRTEADRYEKSGALGEVRLQLDGERRWIAWGLKVVADFVYDSLADEREIDLETGRGWLDLRQASVFVAPLPFLDLKAGRQILTWGSGDLVFINDNFPKDWVSFFAGRDVEYLKAPSDAVRASFFSPAVNVEAVYTPRFDPDRYLTGERMSYFNASLGRRSGRDAVVEAAVPDEWFADDEFAWRIYRTLGGYELALYGYRGYWKSPAGIDGQGRATFPPLAVYGGSARGPLAGGIGTVEGGWFDSRSDGAGNDPAVRNGELRLLAGYERDLSSLAPDFTVGLQYYLEHMLDHRAYLDSLPRGAPSREENRHVLTLRLTRLMLRQTLELSLFAYWSPSDEDAYLRPWVGYKLTDAVLLTAGGNIFTGREEHTFFGQFEHNSNIYGGVRYSF